MAQTLLSYEELVVQIHQLEPSQQAALLQELAGMVGRQLAKRRRSILELRGLGKEIWAGIDAQEYVRAERAAWSTVDEREQG